MDLRKAAFAFLRSSRQFPEPYDIDLDATDRLDLDVNVDIVNLLDKSRQFRSVSCAIATLDLKLKLRRVCKAFIPLTLSESFTGVAKSL
jgi:hypothetical protein